MYPLYTMNTHKYIPDLLQRCIVSFLIISVRSELDSPTVSVLITNSSRVHRVCVNAVIRQKSVPKIISTKWFYFGDAINNADGSIYAD